MPVTPKHLTNNKMKVKHIGFQLDESLVDALEQYRLQLSEEKMRKVSRTELMTEIIKERLSKDFWTQKE